MRERLARGVGKVLRLGNVDSKLLAAGGQILHREGQPRLLPRLPLLPYLRVPQSVVGDVSDELVRRERDDALDANVGALEAGEAEEVGGDFVGELSGGGGGRRDVQRTGWRGGLSGRGVLVGARGVEEGWVRGGESEGQGRAGDRDERERRRTSERGSCGAM